MIDVVVVVWWPAASVVLVLCCSTSHTDTGKLCVAGWLLVGLGPRAAPYVLSRVASSHNAG